MKAIFYERFGSPDVLQLRDVDKPNVADDGVLIRVHACSLNAGDWYSMTGTPYIARPSMGFRKPKTNLLGTDYAGRVEEVGKSVTQFKPGDEVFGARTGALAEYVSQTEKRVATKPSSLSFEEAAAVPVAALTALQGLRDKGRVQPGQNVLINGASGGVGTFAVQIAKALGAEVTGVCSTRNVEMVGSLGADHVIDYTQEDFTIGDPRFDLMIDVAGSRSFFAYRRVLTPDATVVIVGGPRKGRMLGPLSGVVKARLAAIGKSQTIVFFIAKVDKDDLIFLGELIEAGKLTPVIDRRYDLSEVSEAFRYLGEGHARAKIVVIP